MIIGIDLDNTIINYEALFLKAAQNRGWFLNESLSKKEVKQRLKANDSWQMLQADVYGRLIDEAPIFDGCYEFIKERINSGCSVFIVSHKTEYSNYDNTTNLINPAIDWLTKHKLIGYQGLIPENQISFHPCREDKIKQIKNISCDVFIDDLSEVLLDKHFPKKTWGLLFSGCRHKSLVTEGNWFHLSDFFSLMINNSFSWMIKVSSTNGSLVRNITHCTQGGNNQTRLLEFSNGSKCIVKKTSTDRRALLENEYLALKLLNQCNIKGIPKVISFSSESVELMQSFVEGKNIIRINNSHLDKVIDFILSLNKLDQADIQFTNTADSRSNLNHYVESIDKRWGSIRRDIKLLSNKYKNIIKLSYLFDDIEFLKDKIVDEYKRQLKVQNLDPSESFPDCDKIFSPSDFGFHNMLENQDFELGFLDFEYFVYDDKAKMICDFVHHAGHDLSLEHKIYFISRLNDKLHFSEALKQRILLLLNMVGLEWILIILNIAQKDKLKQKVKTLSSLSVDQMIEKQYHKANKRLLNYKKNIMNKKELFTLGIDQRELKID